MDRKLKRILIIALLARVFIFCLYISYGGKGVFGDTRSYVSSAYTFINEGHFELGSSAVDYPIIRTPGYPLFLAINMFVFGKNYYYATAIIQIILNVISIFFLYHITNSFTHCKKKSIGVCVFASLNFYSIYYCFALMTDSISQS